MRKTEYLNNLSFRDHEYQNQNFVIDSHSLCIFGPKAHFFGCEFEIETKEGQFGFLDSFFTDCKFRFIRVLKRVQFHNTQLHGCKLIGQLQGCDFGPRPGIGSASSNGALTRCDLRDAILDDCRFFNLDITANILPTWPTFTITDYAKAAACFARQKNWPGAKEFAAELRELLLSGEVAVSMHGPTESKEIGCSSQELRDFLEGKKFVRI